MRKIHIDNVTEYYEKKQQRQKNKNKMKLEGKTENVQSKEYDDMKRQRLMEENCS